MEGQVIGVEQFGCRFDVVQYCVEGGKVLWVGIVQQGVELCGDDCVLFQVIVEQLLFYMCGGVVVGG